MLRAIRAPLFSAWRQYVGVRYISGDSILSQAAGVI